MVTRPKSGSQCDRLLGILLDGHWHGGPHEFGTLWHKASTRIGELRRMGYVIEPRVRRDEHGKRKWQEYRLVGFRLQSLPDVLEAASVGGAECS